MKRLRGDAEKAPFFHAVIVILFAIGFSSLPLSWMFGFFRSEKYAEIFSGALVRLILAAAAVVLAVKCGFSSQFKTGGRFVSYLLLIPALVVAVNNFPIIGLVSGGEITSDGTGIFLYILYCLSVAAFEEITFRGIVFPLVLTGLKNKKYPQFFSVVVSSAMFAAAHVFNLFAGASFGATALQTGYSFLIGAMCAISQITVKNVYVPVAFHFIYDLGGLMYDETVGIAAGIRWDAATVWMTAVIGVIVAVYMTILLVRTDKNRAFDIFGITRESEENGDKDGSAV